MKPYEFILNAWYLCLYHTYASKNWSTNEYFNCSWSFYYTQDPISAVSSYSVRYVYNTNYNAFNNWLERFVAPKSRWVKSVSTHKSNLLIITHVLCMVCYIIFDEQWVWWFSDLVVIIIITINMNAPIFFRCILCVYAYNRDNQFPYVFPFTFNFIFINNLF